MNRVIYDKSLEKHIVEQENVDLIVNAFKRCQRRIFMSLVEPFIKLISFSPLICQTFAENSDFITFLAEWCGKVTDPRQQKIMLQMIQKLFQQHSEPTKFVTDKVINAVKGYEKNSKAAIVRKVAADLLKEFEEWPQRKKKQKFNLKSVVKNWFAKGKNSLKFRKNSINGTS